MSRARRIERTALDENAILRGLDASTMDAIVEHGEHVHCSLRQQIYTPNRSIDTVYFPIDCVLSVITHMKDGSSIEIGTVGREGHSAVPLMLGATTTANDSYCQVRGAAITIPADLFAELSRTDREFQALLDRYLQAYVNMLGQLAACNRLHSVYERCARWLLMTHDRVHADSISLTHEFLAMMLGTGRSGVTIAAATLQQAGYISYAHGVITIRDRSGLEEASCECYEVAAKQFGGLLRRSTAPPGNGAPRAELRQG